MFGYWTVIRESDHQSPDHSRYWECVCRCGTTGRVTTRALNAGKSRSCGCRRLEATPWNGRCSRCNETKAPDAFTPSMCRTGGWCRACINERRREVLTPAARRRNNLWSIYRLRPGDYDALLQSQGGGCAICGNKENLHIDHDHACCPGKRCCGRCIRGILCGACNIAIGHMAEDSDRMRKAIGYLEGAVSASPGPVVR